MDQSKNIYKVYLEKDYLESYKKIFVRPNIEMTLQTRKNNLIEDLPEYLNYALEYKQCRVTLTFEGIIKTENYQKEKILLPEYSYSYQSKAVIIDVSEYIDEWSMLEREKTSSIIMDKIPLRDKLGKFSTLEKKTHNIRVTEYEKRMILDLRNNFTKFVALLYA